MAAIPAVVALMSWLFLREHMSLRVKLAVLCAVTGIALAAGSRFTQPSAASTAGSMLGNLLIFAAVLCEAAYAVIGKKLTRTLGARRISSLINLWGFVLMTPLGLAQALRFDFTAVDAGTWLLLVFYSLAASVWTVWLWMTGMKSVPAGQSGVFTVFLPISAALVGVGVLGESMVGLQLLAFGIALLGVVLATLPERTPQGPGVSR
jgi:drug/metabolite transporter (DMT)-like permease